MTTTYFRSQRDLPPAGTLIEPSRRFFDSLDDTRETIEAVFEKTRPCGKPKRASALFLFEDIQDAREHCVSHSDHLLEVELEPQAVFHRADWSWLGTAAGLPDNQEFIERCAADYWAGLRNSTKAVWEILVSSARLVREVAITQAQRDEILRRLHGLSPADIANGFHLG